MFNLKSSDGGERGGGSEDMPVGKPDIFPGFWVQYCAWDTLFGSILTQNFSSSDYRSILSTSQQLL